MVRREGVLQLSFLMPAPSVKLDEKAELLKAESGHDASFIRPQLKRPVHLCAEQRETAGSCESHDAKPRSGQNHAHRILEHCCNRARVQNKLQSSRGPA